MRREQLPALTGIRFVAALVVVIHHFGQGVLPAGWAIARDLTDIGYVAVSLFFILSGFVLTHAYAASGRMRGTARAFYRGRAARLLPLYLLGCALALPTLAWSPPEPLHTPLAVSVAATITGTPAWFPFSNSIDPPSWSLSAEAFFYALFPLLLAPLCRLRVPALLGVLTGCYALTLAGPLVYMHVRPDGPGYDWARYGWLRALSFGPPLRLPEFAAGMALGRLHALWPARRGGDLLVAVPCVALWTILPHAYLIPFPLLHNGVLDVLWCPLLLGLARPGLIAAALGCRPMVALGEASFGLYLLHWPIHAILTGVVGTPPPGQRAPLFLAYLALSVAASLLAVRCVERPARAWLLRRRAPAHSFQSSMVA